MDPAGTVAAMTQFGVAGVMGAMWLIERRASAKREEQLTQAHEQLITQLSERGALVEIVRDNTRALALLEASQRGLVDALLARVPGGAGGR